MTHGSFVFCKGVTNLILLFRFQIRISVFSVLYAIRNHIGTFTNYRLHVQRMFKLKHFAFVTSVLGILFFFTRDIHELGQMLENSTVRKMKWDERTVSYNTNASKHKVTLRVFVTLHQAIIKTVWLSDSNNVVKHNKEAPKVIAEMSPKDFWLRRHYEERIKITAA